MRMKKKSSDTEDVVRKLIESLAQQLIRESEDARSMLESSNLEEVLRRVTEDLPAGKLRSTLLQQVNSCGFVVALQDAIKAKDTIKATCATVMRSGLIQDDRTPISINSSGERLSAEGLWKSFESGCSNSEQGQELSAEVGRRFLSCRDPSLNVLWAIAAQLIRCDGNENKLCSALLSTKALLRCLKPLIVGHSTASTAVAALAPVAVVMFDAVQESSNPLQLSIGERDSHDTTSYLKRAQKHIKTLQTMVREVLSFIVVCRNKKESSEGPSSPTSGPRLSDLLNVFLDLLRSVKLESRLGRSDVLVVTERLKLLFPFFPYSVVKALKRPHLNVDKLSEVVTLEFVVIHLMLEVIKWRNRLKMHVGKTEALHQRFTARMRTMAIQSVAAADIRDDVILDLLLSGLSVDNKLLDEEEKGFINVLLYRAFLVEDLQFDDMTMVTVLTGKTKFCKTFLKKVAVARNTNGSYRSLNERNQSFDLLCRLHVPSEFVQWLKTAKIKQKPPENGLLSRPWILIGWLLNLEDVDFKEIVDKVSSLTSKRLRDQQGQTLKGDDPSNIGENDQNYASARNIHSQIEPKALFFVDTLGEKKKKSYAGDDPIAFVSAGEVGKKCEKGRFHFAGSLLANGRENESE